MTGPALFRECIVVTAVVVAVAVAGIWAGAPRIEAQSLQQMYLTVLDKDGRPVADLRPDEVSIAENGVRRDVVYMARPGEPADISLLVDTSGAMVPATTHVRNALSAFVDALDGHARMSLVTFGDLPVRRVEPTTDMTRMQDAIDGLFPTEGARSRFRDALASAAIDIGERRPSRPTIVVLTADQSSSGRWADLEHRVEPVVGLLQMMGAPVHVVAIRSEPPFDVFSSSFSRSTPGWWAALETVAGRTGGRLSTVRASVGLRRPLLELADEILGQYVITYSRPAEDVAVDTLEIGVGIARDDLTVRVTLVT